jgi:hypothetical protein
MGYTGTFSFRDDTYAGAAELVEELARRAPGLEETWRVVDGRKLVETVVRDVGGGRSLARILESDRPPDEKLALLRAL